jgi:lysophospholipase L1-like esterase
MIPSHNLTQSPVAKAARFAGICTVTAALLGAACPQSGQAQNILPLGDSITDGYQVPGGYRTELYKDLTNAGAVFSFMGSQTDNPSAVLTAGGQIHHEGHSGYRTDQIYNNLLGSDGTAGNNGGYWLDGGNGTGRSAISPDVVLLHIGTNDRTQGETLQTMYNKLVTLLTDLKADLPNAKIFVASLIPRTDDPSAEATQQAYNALIPGLVASMGANFHFVDMHSVVTPAEVADGNSGLHPDQAGYDAMGDAWFNAIRTQTGQVAEVDQSNIGDNNSDAGNSTFYFTSGQTTTPAAALAQNLVTGSIATGTTPDVGSLAGLSDLLVNGTGVGGLNNMTYYGNGAFGNALVNGAVATVTIQLGGANPSTGGYTLNRIAVFGGWTDHASFNDQFYTVSVSMDGTNFAALHSVNYMPFNTADDLVDAGTQDASSLVIMTNLNANGLASGIKYVRLALSAGTDGNATQQEGQLIQELEVFGASTSTNGVPPGKAGEIDLSNTGDNNSDANNSQFYYTSGQTTTLNAALRSNLLTGSTVTSSTGGADVGNLSAINDLNAQAGTGGIAYFGNTLYGNSLSPANATTLGVVTLTIPLGGANPNTNGYSLSTVSVFSGWTDHASFCDQHYTVSISQDGTNYIYLDSVNYMPFLAASDLGSGQSSSTLVTLTNLNLNGLATGVKFIQFTLSAGTDSNGQLQEGQLLQEIEVFGTPSPAPGAIAESDQSAIGDNGSDADNSQFYFTSGQTLVTGSALIPNLATGSTVVSSTGGADVGSPAAINDVNAVAGTGAIAYYGNTQFGNSLNSNNLTTHGLVTLTIPLGGASPDPKGYTLRAISVFEGWSDHASFNDQHYIITTSTDGTNYTYLYTVNYMPFATADDIAPAGFQDASTLVSLSGIDVTNVKSIQITLSAGIDSNDQLQEGQLIQEVEIFGTSASTKNTPPGEIGEIDQSNIGDNSSDTNNSQFYYTSGRTANTSAALRSNLLTGSTITSSTGGADVGNLSAINDLNAQGGVGAIAYYGNTLYGSSLNPNNGVHGQVTLTMPLGGASPSASGYALSSLSVFSGWTDHASFCDQNYSIYVSQDGTNFLYLTAVNYLPFLATNDLGGNQSSSTLVTLTNLNIKGLATGIKYIQFVLSAGTDGNGQTQEGELIQEIEVFGTPAAGATSVVENDQSNIGDNNSDAQNSQFYFTSGQSTVTGAALVTNLATGATITSTTGGADVGSLSAVNDVNALPGTGAIAYYGNTLFGDSLNPGNNLTHGTVTLTIPLGGACTVTNLSIFEGWSDHASFNDQHYVITTSANGTNYSYLYAVNYMPFATSDDISPAGLQDASSLVTLSSLSVTNTRFVRFTLSAGLDANGQLQEGQLIQEIEVNGSRSVSSIPVITAAKLAGGSLVFSGTNGAAGATYYLLGATNVATPLAQWTVIATNTFDSNGHFFTTNAVNSKVPQQFYTLKLK